VVANPVCQYSQSVKSGAPHLSHLRMNAVRLADAHLTSELLPARGEQRGLKEVCKRNNRTAHLASGNDRKKKMSVGAVLYVSRAIAVSSNNDSL
jgi:hypothetical protein